MDIYYETKPAKIADEDYFKNKNEIKVSSISNSLKGWITRLGYNKYNKFG